jgi:hypothetical protein
MTIADDVFFAVKARARSERRSAGEVISELLRQSLTTTDAMHPARATDGREERLRARGFRPLPHRGGATTNDLVNRLREELDL